VTTNGLLQLVFYFAVLTALAVPLGRYMAAVYEGRAGFAQRVLGPLERLPSRSAPASYSRACESHSVTRRARPAGRTSR
jgi:K+-transporting ATPase A subunit